MKRSIDVKLGKQVSERYHFVQDDEESVLMFWSLFGVLTFVHEYLEGILGWVPLYYVSKCALLAFLSTSTEGSRFVFKFISPMVSAQSDLYVPKIQNETSKIARKIHQVLIRLVLEGADSDELERLQKTLQRQLQNIRTMREKKKNKNSKVADSSEYEEDSKTT